jgi:hypothetical protein
LQVVWNYIKLWEAIEGKEWPTRTIVNQEIE